MKCTDNEWRKLRFERLESDPNDLIDGIFAPLGGCIGKLFLTVISMPLPRLLGTEAGMLNT